ncbi:MAG: hypothetical protein RIC12_01295 [Pirellulales bacterium]
MRLSEAQVRQGVLYPVEQVRLAAVGSFADAYSPDTSLMPMVIDAVKRYGREGAFPLLRRADSLAQCTESIDWIIAELDQDIDVDRVSYDNYRFALGLLLIKADPGLLVDRQTEILGARLFPKQLRDGFSERLEMFTWSWEQGLSSLEAILKQPRAFTMADSRRVERIVEALARHTNHADDVLSRLEKTTGGNGSHDLDSLEPFMVQLAGKMRLDAAVPVLIEKLLGSDLDVSDDCVTALGTIGTDEVVGALRSVYWDADPEDRIGIIEPMESVHTELAVDTLLELFHGENNLEPAIYLGTVLLGKFDGRAIEPVRELILSNKDDEEHDPELEDLRIELIVSCMLMDRYFPEFDAWKDRAEACNWGWHDYVESRIAKNFSEDDASDAVD